MGETTIGTAKRMSRIPPYLFAEIDRKVREKKAAGIDVISLGIGDPDLPTPARIVSAAQEAVADPANHQYPSYFGLRELREAIADWYRGRFGVPLDPDSQVLPTLGSKDGISHVPFAFVDPGDVVLAPDPGYTPYATGAIMAEGEPHLLPLTLENGWLPDLDAVPADVRRRAKLLWLNYPNNPTAATAPDAFFEQAIAFCRENGIILCHDAPYSEIAFEGYRPPSLLQFPGAIEVGLEFHSVSKTYNMTGWRLGWICGNAELVRAVGQLKTNLDSGIFQAVQWASVEALRGGEQDTKAANAVYHRRHQKVAEVLNRTGWDIRPPRATFYVWAPVPPGYDSIGFAAHVLDQAAVNLTPGVGFGPHGEGYFRLSVTAPDARLDEALSRLEKLSY
ncbi:MAG: aminotransferase class I/II-fold pyridoxal phosphate-dependent enzyme [Chloroflexi bacterium]|nr:MAG: aminotransferase class I/II-fold pyridoxal phosphate-dependent enzyme [Chloroflexota bacterium]TME19266.1 MAG: aminotransferase class I/II-fold pyridoxal phosphate-dependent enzyme [Chloroflexota bacterium]